MTVIDIGSNIGYYAIMESKLCHTVYAIEPVFENYRILELNLNLNNCHNVFKTKVAIGYTTDDCTKLYYGNKLNQASILSKGPNCILVDTIRLDDFVKNINTKVDYIRMDVEGYEFYIFFGMLTTLKKFRPKLFIEVHPYQMLLQGLDFRLFITRLLELGYIVTYIIKEYGPNKEKAIWCGENIFKTLYDNKMNPTQSEHGFGMFMEYGL